MAAPQFPRARRPVHRVLIEARDSGPRPPQTKGTNDDGASRGTDRVLLVAALSTRWNWYPTPSFLVTATDDTGAEYAGSLSRCSVSIDTLEGGGTSWLWPPVDPRARQLRVTVSTLWEAAWALLDIPGR